MSTATDRIDELVHELAEAGDRIQAQGDFAGPVIVLLAKRFDVDLEAVRHIGDSAAEPVYRVALQALVELLAKAALHPQAGDGEVTGGAVDEYSREIAIALQSACAMAAFVGYRLGREHGS